MIDVRVENHGSIFVVQPLTPTASDWMEEHVHLGEATWWGGGLVVEPRYVSDLVGGMAADGLSVE